MRLIDADELRKRMSVSEEFLQSDYPYDDYTRGYADSRLVALDAISFSPTIDAKIVKHGHWIDDGESKFICSACNKGIYRWFGRQDYCPRCGAVMDEKECEQNATD